MRTLAESQIGEIVDKTGTNASRLGTRLVEILAIYGNAWAATNAYEDLSRLSNAELGRRGIPRGGLHRRVFDVLNKS